MKAVTALLLLGIWLTLAHDRPVIGILDQPLNGDPTKSSPSYIAASYVKYIESAGARVIPIHFNSSTETLNFLFARLNGVLFTGGGTDLTPGTKFYETGNTIFTNAVRANNNGDFFPLWGTCMGFQFLSILAAQDASVLSTGFDSENLPIPLNLTILAKNSRLFRGASDRLLTAFAKENITMNNHHDGVTPDKFVNNPRLRDMYNVLSTNVDRKNVQFVSTFEGKTLPFYGVQWHPEKNQFEWTTKEQLPHSPIAIEAAQYTANFFVNEARKSSHTFTEAELEPLLIYNYQTTFTQKTGSTFTQEYIWK